MRFTFVDPTYFIYILIYWKYYSDDRGNVQIRLLKKKDAREKNNLHT